MELKEKIKLIIAGSRDFKDYTLLEHEVNKFLLTFSDYAIEIVSGGQISKPPFGDKDHDNPDAWWGADWLGEKFASLHGIPVKPFPADWKKYRKAAGPIRNEEMAEYGTHLIVFYHNKSTGSKDMLKKAKAHNLTVIEIKFELTAA